MFLLPNLPRQHLGLQIFVTRVSSRVELSVGLGPVTRPAHLFTRSDERRLPLHHIPLAWNAPVLLP